MAQGLPPGKAVQARHLQQLPVHAPHPVAQVDDHRGNRGCCHDEDAGPSVEAEPDQSQHHPADRGDRLEHMNQRRPHILQLGVQTEQQPQHRPGGDPDPQAGHQPQERSPHRRPEIRLPDQLRQGRRHLRNGRHHQGREEKGGQLPESQQQANPQGAAEPESRLSPHSTVRRPAAPRRSWRGQSR